jgi:3-hydroxyisobutyrate dehydrogenase-like beta-hydroxyacid dehydrogenase
MMIGGGHAADERTKPLLEACATDVVHVGTLGSAMSLRMNTRPRSGPSRRVTA